MVRVLPFRGVRYNLDKVKNLSSVVTLPYDIITPKMQDEYYQKSPHSFIRIDFGKEEPSDGERENKYTRATETFSRWLKEGILMQESSPAIYLYEQRYTVNGVCKRMRGFIAMVEITDYANGDILPHEDTLKAPVADRMLLTRSVGAQLSQLMTLYKDQDGAVEAILDRYTTCEPIVIPDSDHDIEHRIWVIRDPAGHRDIERVLSQKKLYIADGHHRYRTAINFRAESKAVDPSPSPLKAYNYMMTMCIDMNHEGLTVLPTHRLIHSMPDFDLKRILDRASEYFEVERYQFARNADKKKELANLLEEMEIIGKLNHAYGFYAGGDHAFYLLYLKNAEAYERMLNVPHSRFWKRLDVTLLQTLFIERILHISKEEVTDQKYLTYVKDAWKAIEKVDQGECQIALLMNATPVESVVKIADLAERMPQKSTYFYPKLLSGIVSARVGMEDYLDGLSPAE